MPTTTLPFSTPTIAPHLHPYQLPLPTYLTTTKPSQIPTSHLVASAAVIHPASNRILLLQRAAHSFQPLLWELPGGRCESRDSSIIASAVRELWEESGLVVRRILDVVGEYQWLDRGDVWRKVAFLVEVEGGEGNEVPKIVVDPKEQEGFVWATEEEVVEGKCGVDVLKWTSDEQKEVVLKAFKLL